MHPAYVIEGLSQHGDFHHNAEGSSSSLPANPTKQDEDNKTLDTSSLSFVSESSSEGESNSNINAQSKVKFDMDASSTQIVRSRHEMDEAEFSSIWYSHSEFASIASWNRMTVRIYRQHIRECTMHTQDELLKDLDLDAEGQQCIRGLEHRLKGEQSKRQEIKTNAIYSVLGEQAKFKREKLPVDQLKLALVYKEHTFAIVADGAQTGLRDERIAKEVHAESDTRQEEKSSIDDNETRVSRKSGLLRALDDCDLKELQYDDEDDDNSSEGGSVEGIAKVANHQQKKRDDDDDSFRAKAKREKKGLSFSKFFFKSKKNKKKASTKDSKKKYQKRDRQKQELQQQTSPVVVRRKQLRRSSM